MTDHTVTLRNPFGPGRRYMGLAGTQRRLLEPYRRHLRGFGAFSVRSRGTDLDKALARAVEEQVRREVVPSPQEFLGELNRLKEQGNELFRAGNAVDAGEYWCRALSLMQRVVSSRKAWPTMRAAGGVGYAEAVTGVVFQLISNRMAADVRVIRTMPRPDGDVLAHMLGSILQGAAMSGGVGEIFGVPGWEPDPAQEAKIGYRVAVGVRLAGGPLDVGHGFISRALEKAPDDAQIRREKEEYMRLGVAPPGPR